MVRACKCDMYEVNFKGEEGKVTARNVAASKVSLLLANWSENAPNGE